MPPDNDLAMERTQPCHAATLRCRSSSCNCINILSTPAPISSLRSLNLLYVRICIPDTARYQGVVLGSCTSQSGDAAGSVRDVEQPRAHMQALQGCCARLYPLTPGFTWPPQASTVLTTCQLVPTWQSPSGRSGNRTSRCLPPCIAHA